MLKKEEHPHIIFTVHTISLVGQNGTAGVTINIAGVPKRETIHFTHTKNGSWIRVVAKKELTLTQFGIEPPTALFGLVRVKDRIVVNFDVMFKLGN